jgi:molybdate transport system ATP-binding protein
MEEESFISMRDCRIGDVLSPALESVSWRLAAGEVWAVVGPSGGGKEDFAAAVAGLLHVAPGDGGWYRNGFAGRTALVSFEAAAELLRQERYNDDSDFVEGGISEGTSVRAFITAGLQDDDADLYPRGTGLDSHPAVLACGLTGGDADAGLLDRGLKRLSTGECRRALLARALASKPGLLVAIDPYEGLDMATRSRLHTMLDALAAASVAGDATAPVLLIVDRFEHLPAAVNRIVELAGGAIVFAGSRPEYETVLFSRASAGHPSGQETQALQGMAEGVLPPSSRQHPVDGSSEPLVELRNVTVSWSGRAVLDGISWTVQPGEHWLVRGPNGSGKTTLLELITGDNPQAYREDVRVFGLRRGSGGTVWELKSRLGIVSYRLHLEYRYLDESSLEDVLVSGLRDSIGLYASASDGERALAGTWLRLSGFYGRERERFGRLSFGEQRALLVARAAIKAPELLVLDEPCHGLDDDQRRFVMSLLSAIATRGESTMLHVTHDPDEVQSFERHILELRPNSTPSWFILPSCIS